MKVEFYHPHVGAEEKQAVSRVIDSGWMTTGKEAKALEEEFARINGSKYALAVSSATAGLHLAAICSPNSLMNIADYNFVSAFQVAKYAGRSCELLPSGDKWEMTHEHRHGWNYVVLHFGGKLFDFSHLSQNAFVIEDCAHRLPCEGYRKGNIQVFSFYANKLLTCGEGGMVCTDDLDIYERMKDLYYHGMDRIKYDRKESEYTIARLGYKYNMSDISAAMVRCQLTKIDVIKNRRVEIAEKYDEALGQVGIEVQDAGADNHYHLYPILCNSVDQANQIMDNLKENGIEYSRHYQPLSTWHYTRDNAIIKAGTFEHDKNIYDRSISLPIYVDLKDEEQDFVIEKIVEAI